MSTVNSSSPYTYGNYDNPGYASGGGVTPPPVVNATEILAQRGTLPTPPPSGVFPGGAPSQLASILVAQNASRQANVQQKAYTESLDNPEESAYHQANLSKTPVIIPQQRTASTVSEAEQNFNDLVTSTQQSLSKLGSDVPAKAPSGQSTYSFSGSVDAPSILALLPGSSGPSPKPTVAPLAATEKIVNYSAGTNAFRADTAQTLAQLTSAKNAGLTSLDIFDQGGKKIGTTNPQDITRARYDILEASIASGGPVSAKGALPPILTNTSTSAPQYVRSNDNVFKSALASIVEPAAYIGLSLAAPIANLLNMSILGVKPGATEQDVTNQIQKSIGTTYLDQIMQGDFNPTDMTPAEKAASLIGSGIGLYLTAGGPGLKANIGSDIGSAIKNVPSLIDDLDKGTFSNSGVVDKIASGLKEGSIIQNTGPRELITGNLEKGSPIREITQGTIDKSGIESFNVEKAPPIIEPTGKMIDIMGVGAKGEPKIFTQPEMKTSYPQLPKGLSETTDITGIGAKGQPKIFTQPTEINLEPGLEGQAKNPYALINPKGGVVIVRSEPQDILPIDKLLVQFQGITPEEAAGRAVHYGLEEVPGMKNTYFGEANAHNVEALAQAIKSKNLKIGTDLFQFGSKDFAKSPLLYGKVTTHPEIIKEGAFPSVTRPSVIRYFEGGIETKIKAPKIGRNSLVPSKNMRPLGSGQFGLTDLSDITNSKVGAGAAGRAMSLLKNTEVLAKNFGKVTMETPKPRYDFGRFVTVPITTTRGRGKASDELEYETLVYPQIINVKPIGRSRIKSGPDNALLSNIGLSQVSDMISKPKENKSLLNITKPGSKFNTKLKGTLDQIVFPKFGFGTDLTIKQSTTQSTVQTTGVIQITIPGIAQRQTTKMPPILGGLWNFNWGYPTGRNKKRVNRFRPSFFTYSVNPDVVGALAQAGQPGKVVSNSLRFKGIKYAKGPNFSHITKGFTGKNDNALLKLKGPDLGKIGKGLGGSKRGKRTRNNLAKLGNINIDLRF